MERIGIELGGVRVPRASEVLADELRGRILDGAIGPGQMLPNERNLAEESGLSRTVVRESLRILEIEGLVETRPGRNGGTAVRRPDQRSFARSVDIFVRGRRLRFHELLEARELLEPACAQLAAEQRTDAGLAELVARTEAVRRAVEDVDAFLTENARWHVTVASLGRNELLSAFMLALGDAVRAATDIDEFNSADVRAAALAAHDRILDAIRAGDGAAARHAMERHVRAFREQVSGFAVPDELDVGGGTVARGQEDDR